MAERLRRLERIFERTPVYFVTAGTHERRKLLANDAAHRALLQFAEQGPAHGVWLGAFVLMPDHLHAFVVLDNLELSAWMKSLKNALSKSFREAGIPSPHWQKGYFDHVLRSEESYGEKWEYVRSNPVRAGLVGRWEEWPYFAEPFHWNIGATQREALSCSGGL